MPPCLEFHTTQPGMPAVYHDNSACAEGQKIQREHRRLGRGADGRFCGVCANLNVHGR